MQAAGQFRVVQIVVQIGVPAQMCASHPVAEIPLESFGIVLDLRGLPGRGRAQVRPVVGQFGDLHEAHREDVRGGDLRPHAGRACAHEDQRADPLAGEHGDLGGEPAAQGDSHEGDAIQAQVVEQVKVGERHVKDRVGRWVVVAAVEPGVVRPQDGELPRDEAERGIPGTEITLTVEVDQGRTRAGLRQVDAAAADVEDPLCHLARGHLARGHLARGHLAPGRRALPGLSLSSGSSGMISFSMKERTVSRICRSSSLSEKSTIGGCPYLLQPADLQF